jgi:3-hydroxyacyl-CoA dehydrogenase
LTGESTNDSAARARLGIAGSGAIARGLASIAADGFDVVLWARSDGSAERVRGAVPADVEVVTALTELASADLLVEAVAEDRALKRELHARLGGMLGDGALLATTTSALSVTELATASGRADRFAALHVFNPVDRMELVELAFPPAATGDTRRRFKELCERLGKTPVEVPDSAGFVVNRLLFPYLFNAVRLLDEDGMSPEAVDTCMRLGAGHPMGPLALLDFVGLDVAAAIGDSIGIEVPARVRTLVDSGRLGRKVGAGFYDYD